MSGAGHQYVDLQNTRLFIKAKILKHDGSDIPMILKNTEGKVVPGNMNPEAFVSPVNLWLHSLFGQVDMIMQQKVVNSCHLYPYKSYLETLIYPYEEWLGESELFYKDSASDMDATEVLGSNEGLTRRNFRGIKSTEIDMEGPLHLDLCRQNRYIMNGVDWALRLWHAKDSFRLMSAIGDCKVKVTEAILKVCKVDISPTVMATHNQVMRHTMSAKYPYERTEMKTFTITPGLLSFSTEDVFQGEVPNKVVLGLVSTTSFFGNFKENPFNLKHAYISEIGVKVDDTPVPAKPIKT